MAHGEVWEGKWRGNRRLERVATTLALYLGTLAIHGPSADPHSSTASSQLNWLPRRFKWTRQCLWKTKSGFCACAITFQTCSTRYVILAKHWMWLPDNDFMWTETCWSSFYNFNYFNNLRIFKFVCISWTLVFKKQSSFKLEVSGFCKGTYELTN
jgi:hypothetical protein